MLTVFCRIANTLCHLGNIYYAEGGEGEDGGREGRYNNSSEDDSSGNVMAVSFSGDGDGGSMTILKRGMIRIIGHFIFYSASYFQCCREYLS